MFLQVKHDLLSGRLRCSDDDVAQLSALALQCQSFGRLATQLLTSLFMTALRSRCGHYILPCDFYILLFSSPNLSSRRLDVYCTSTHDVALVRINACLKCAARGSLKIQDAKKSPSAYHHTTLSGYILATKARIDNRKNTC